MNEDGAQDKANAAETSQQGSGDDSDSLLSWSQSPEPPDGMHANPTQTAAQVETSLSLKTEPAQPRPRPPSPGVLPPGWFEATANNGCSYYYNQARATTWQRPTVPATAATPPTSPDTPLGFPPRPPAVPLSSEPGAKRPLSLFDSNEKGQGVVTHGPMRREEAQAEAVDDGPKEVNLGRLVCSAGIWEDPQGPKDQQGNSLIVVESESFDGAEVRDSENNSIGRLRGLNGRSLNYFFLDEENRGFRCEAHLLNPNLFSDLKPGFYGYGDTKIAITMFASSDYADNIRDELKNSGIELEAVASSSVQDFQAEASKQKADSRAEREEEAELRHPPRAKSPAQAAEQMEMKHRKVKPVADDEAIGSTNAATLEIPEDASPGKIVEIATQSAATPVATMALQGTQGVSARLELADGKDEHVAGNASPSTVITKPNETTSSLERIPEVQEKITKTEAMSPQVQQAAIRAEEASADVQRTVTPTQAAPSAGQQAIMSNQDTLRDVEQAKTPTQVTPLDIQQATMPTHAAHAAPAEIQLETANTTPAVTDEQIADFLEDTETTSVQGAHWYIITNGTVRKAVKRFHKDQKAQMVLKEPTPPPVDPAPLDLVEESLQASSVSLKPKPKGYQSRGNALAILDGQDLSRSCRLDSSDLCVASPFFKDSLAFDASDASDVQGIRYLFVLQKPRNGEMPILVRKSLSTMRQDCAGEMFTASSTVEDLDCVINDVAARETSNRTQEQSPPARSRIAEMQLKQEGDQTDAQSEAQASIEKAIDWQGGYEDFFCLLARFRPKFYDTKDIKSAILKLEIVAQIASAYDAVNFTSPVTTSMADLFNRHRVEQQLWEAVAADASRWLRISIWLKNVPIFNEAFVHVAGCFPDWPWSVPQNAFSAKVLETIEMNSSALTEQRWSIDRALTLTTLSGAPPHDRTILLPVSQKNNPVAYNVVNIWRDWISNHLAVPDSEDGAEALPNELCTHPDDGECLSLAGFYRRIGEGGGAYLPNAQVVKNWDEAFVHIPDSKRRQVDVNSQWDSVKRYLKELKEIGSELVAPLVHSNLQFKGKLKYLTCIEVEEGDVPWEIEVKGEDDEMTL